MTSEVAGPEVEWDELSAGNEISATVIMAAGFVLTEGQRVRERYKIERVLGEGAMGQVHAVKLVGAADTQTYALKVVARTVDEGHVDEAQRAEAMRHAQWFATLLRAEAAKQDQVQRHGVSVARLFALVQLDDGSIGMRMELARGRSLESWIDAQRTDPTRPADVMASLGAVRKLVSQLRRLHEMIDSGSPFGFVHSDIKPGNVFMDDSDSSDVHVTLLDFGVATAGQALAKDISMHGGGRKTFVLQQTGGTIGYAPPSHFITRATPLSDVFASLVILYELIALDWPWNFGEMAITGENIMLLEAAVLRGPRPVRELRPSLPLEEARVLDEFFSREFGTLNAMSEQVYKIFNSDSELGQRKLSEKLSRLAKDYQVKLDQLRAQLTPSRRPQAGELLPLSPDDLIERPTPLAIPKAPRVPAFENAPTYVPMPPATRPSKPMLVVVESIAPPAMRRPSSSAEGDEVTESEAVPRAVWLVAVLGIAAVATVTFVLLTRKAPQGRPVPRPAQPAVEPMNAAPSAPVPVPAVAVPANTGDSSAPLNERESLTIDQVRSAPEEPSRVPVAEVPVAGPAAAPGAQSCTCVSSVRGVQVVANGGTIDRETILCVAEQPAPDGRAEFFGTGSIAADVFAATPRIQCRGDVALETTVRRYATASGPALLFRCRAQGPTEAPSSAAGSLADAGGVEGTDAGTGTRAAVVDAATSE